MEEGKGKSIHCFAWHEDAAGRDAVGLCKANHQLLVLLGEWKKGKANPSIALPGTKMRQGEMPSDSVKRIINCWCCSANGRRERQIHPLLCLARRCGRERCR